jgi:hypothetical protein
MDMNYFSSIQDPVHGLYMAYKIGHHFFYNNIKKIPMTSGGYLLGITTSATWRVWAAGIYANGKFASIFLKPGQP